jgi:hypothetical protein
VIRGRLPMGSWQDLFDALAVVPTWLLCVMAVVGFGMLLWTQSLIWLAAISFMLSIIVLNYFTKFMK